MTETESERESNCRRRVDRWASGQVRQVDSAEPLSPLLSSPLHSPPPPLPLPPPPPQLEMWDSLQGCGDRALSENKKKAIIR